MKKLIGAALAALAIGALAYAPAQAAGKKLTIALIPGLTTDAFYITMHKGAQAAADALGDTLVFQGAPDFNPVTQVPVLDAPNTLRLKATGQWTQSGARMLLNEAIATVTTQKRLRASIQVAFLIEFALDGLARPVPDRMSIDHVGRIGGFLDDLLRRLGDDGDHAPVEAVARAIKTLADKARTTAETGPVSADDRDQLQALSRALMQAVDPDRPLEAMTREVSSAVAGYRSRLEQIAQAKAAAASALAASAAEAPGVAMNDSSVPPPPPAGAGTALSAG